MIRLARSRIASHRTVDLLLAYRLPRGAGRPAQRYSRLTSSFVLGSHPPRYQSPRARPHIAHAPEVDARVPDGVGEAE